jgi:Domain of unknown function (DUF4365)
MVYVAQPGDNSLQGDFGEAWLAAVAAGCGILHGPSTTLDRQKTDAHLVLEGLWHGTYNPAVNVQVKTKIALRESDGCFAYDLDIGTYDILRRENESVRRVLVVIGLPKDGERVILRADGTLLAGRGAWVSLEGQPASGNTDTQVVRLPVANTLDRSGLERMLKTYGVRSSTPVPDVEAWR